MTEAVVEPSDLSTQSEAVVVSTLEMSVRASRRIDAGHPSPGPRSDHNLFHHPSAKPKMKDPPSLPSLRLKSGTGYTGKVVIGV